LIGTLNTEASSDSSGSTSTGLFSVGVDRSSDRGGDQTKPSSGGSKAGSEGKETTSPTSPAKTAPASAKNTQENQAIRERNRPTSPENQSLLLARSPKAALATRTKLATRIQPVKKPRRPHPPAVARNRAAMATNARLSTMINEQTNLDLEHIQNAN
jgi:hypothetical protein